VLKLNRRVCVSKVIYRGKENEFGIMLFDGKCGGFLETPAWELVSLWFQIGELFGFDREDARLELERLHWRHDQGELDEQTNFIDKKRKNKPGFKRGNAKW